MGTFKQVWVLYNHADENFPINIFCNTSSNQQLGSAGEHLHLPYRCDWLNCFCNIVEPLLWDTFIQGQEIWSQKNTNIIFVSITSTEGTPLFKEKGHFFGPKTRV